MFQVMKNSSLPVKPKEEKSKKHGFLLLPLSVSSYSSSSSPAAVAVMAVALSLATYFYNSYISFHNGDPVVQTSLGLVQGNVAKSREGRTYYEFLGVPYADSERFERPVPAKPWKGIRSAKDYGPVCMQLDVMVTARVQGNENCLFLNIFTPLKTTKLLPVLVFLHGGLYMAGSPNMYRGKYFLSNDILLVTVSYRLSALGFLSTGDGVLKGNQGLWDQNSALLWIQKEIHKFGGDPNRVTLMGESAGASSVHFHMLSPASNGLFHRAIMQSGSALQIWAMSKSPQTQAKQLGLAMGCPVDNSQVLVKCLKRVDARKLVRYHISSMSPIRRNTDLFVPTVDGDFIPQEPLEMLKNGSFAKIPLMTGVNAGEGLLNTGRILASKYSFSDNLWKYWNEWIPRMLDYDPKRVDISWKIKEEYFKRLAGKPLQDATIANLTQMYSERVYFLDSRKAALLHAKHAPVYMYYYSYPGYLSFFRLFKAVMPTHSDSVAPELKIAMDVGKDIIKKYILRQQVKYMDAPCHADELILQFNTHRLFEISKSSRDYPVSKTLVQSWTDFATNNWTLTYQNSPWNPVDAGSIAGLNAPQYMLIHINGHMIPEPFTKAIQFWQDLGF